MTMSPVMKVTTKSLRTRAREILECVDRGEPVTITYRGRARARLVGIEQDDKARSTKSGELPVSGIWGDRDDIQDVDDYVRNLRRGRRDAD
jgi:prevent-host-death family protein